MSSTLCWFATSVRSASPPIPAATRSPAGPSSSAITIFAPSSASRRSYALPMPWPPPVTMATRSCSLFFIGESIVAPFLKGDIMDKRAHKERYDAGLKTRREVLGAPYVDKAMAGVDDFNQEFVELLNTYCWNDIWNRPGLPRKMRSVLNLGMLTALGKEHELKLHLRGALNNGLTKDEIKEVLMQTAIYCGVPAAVVAFRCAKEVFSAKE